MSEKNLCLETKLMGEKFALALQFINLINKTIVSIFAAPTTTTTTRLPPTSVSTRCGADWYYEQTTNKCYHYDYNMLSFDAAVNACIAINSQLVSIHNTQQENVITGIVDVIVESIISSFKTTLSIRSPVAIDSTLG